MSNPVAHLMHKKEALLAAFGLLVSLGALQQANVDSPKRPEVIGAYISRGLKDVDGAVSDFETLGASGVNLVIDYRLAAPKSGDTAEQAAWERYIKAARDSHIGISFYAGRYLIGATPDTAEEKIADVVAAVNKLKSEPQIASWYMHDEVLPSTNRAGKYGYALSLNQLTDLYNQVHAADPGRPQIAVWAEIKDYDGFSKGRKSASFAGGKSPDWAGNESKYEGMLRKLVPGVCDIAMLDVYPVGKPRALAEAAYRKAVSSRLKRLAELTRSGQKVYFVFQAFSLKQNDPKKLTDARFPTQDEMNAMLSAAADAGASGAIAYCWYNLANPIPSRQIAGVDQAKDDLLAVFKGLSKYGWP